MSDTPATPPATTPSAPVAAPAVTAAPMTQEEILLVCKQIDDAKNGKGPMPDVATMRRALDQIRVNRRAGAVGTSKGKSKAPPVQVDLGALFNT